MTLRKRDSISNGKAAPNCIPDAKNQRFGPVSHPSHHRLKIFRFVERNIGIRGDGNAIMGRVDLSEPERSSYDRIGPEGIPLWGRSRGGAVLRGYRVYPTQTILGASFMKSMPEPFGTFVKRLALAAALFGLIFARAGEAHQAWATEVIFVSNPADLRIDKFAMDGSSLGSIAVPNYGPYGLAVSSQGILYASNQFNQIVRFDSAGTPLDPNAGSPFISTGLSSPYFLAVDSTGQIYASNYGGNSVSVYSSAGALVRTVSNGVSQPYGIAVDGTGKLYVANYGSNTVKTYGNDGLLQSSFDLPFGTNPRGLAVSSDNFLYVTNYYDHTILKYDLAGTLISTITAGLDDPTDLAFDTNGNLYAVNEASKEVSKYTAGSTYVPGFQTAGLTGPYGIAIGVPEPSTYVMAVLAGSVLGACTVRRRRRGNSANHLRVSE